MINDQMSSEERMERFYSGKTIDRVPCITSATMYAGRLCGLTAEEFYMDVKKSYEAQKLICKMHHCDGEPCFDFPMAPIIDFGGELEISKNIMSLPKVKKYPICNIDEAKEYVFPNVEKGYGLELEQNFVRYMHQDTGKLGVCVSAGSPLSTLLNVVEPGLLLRWMNKEPELVHSLLRQMVEYLSDVADIWIKEYGVENCTASACYPAESNQLISPSLFEKFSLPYILKIHEIFRVKGITSFGVHLCGNQDKNLEFYKLLQLEERSFISVDEQTDIKQVVQVLGENYIYAGNVPSRFFLEKSGKSVFEYSKELLQSMKYNVGGFILMPSCDLPLNAFPQSVDAMLQAVQTYGRY